ncbi:MAG TPA: T9SS type A sorting domain-containing protein, partial [Flavobacteriales bacterium]|nr:T9SS type A sorting domain-containing protein [Flavobacteriales bacterium]
NQISSSFSENEASNERLRVYPNPSNNRIYILGAKGELTIHNLIGQEVYSERVNSTISVDISSWSAGVYFVKTNNKTVKILKQ